LIKRVCDIDAGSILIALGHHNLKGEDAITVAFKNGHLEVVKFLIEVMWLNFTKRTELKNVEVAASLEEVSKFMQQYGFDMQDLNKAVHGTTALILATALARNDVALYLIAHQAEPNILSPFGSALHIASQQQNHPVCSALLQAGALMNQKDPNGKTPLELVLGFSYGALSAASVKIARLLVTFGRTGEIGQNISLTLSGIYELYKDLYRKVATEVERATVLKKPLMLLMREHHNSKYDFLILVLLYKIAQELNIQINLVEDDEAGLKRLAKAEENPIYQQLHFNRAYFCRLAAEANMQILAIDLDNESLARTEPSDGDLNHMKERDIGMSSQALKKAQGVSALTVVGAYHLYGLMKTDSLKANFHILPISVFDSDNTPEQELSEEDKLAIHFSQSEMVFHPTFKENPALHEAAEILSMVRQALLLCPAMNSPQKDLSAARTAASPDPLILSRRAGLEQELKQDQLENSPASCYKAKL